MDATVDDFFNEINEIAPPKILKPKESMWQECYDELTGYSYYWNTKTDEVTWTTPADYKSVSDQKKDKNSPKKKTLYVPPRGAPLFPSTSAKIPDESFKIYSIGDASTPKAPERPRPVKKKPQKRPYKHDSDSEDEKIVMISSYGEDSDSETERPEPQKTADTNKIIDSNLSDEDDDMDILTKIQKRAKELKELGGDLPPEVTDIVKLPKSEVEKPALENTVAVKDKKSLAGLSLVAGYSDSEEEDSEIKSLFPVVPQVPKVSHSTLFPITKPIDVKDFLQPTPVQNIPVSPSNDFDSKAFQRKRRIGIALVNTAKKKDVPSDDPESERKGFGFAGNDSTGTSAKASAYTGFKKGGVMFVKSDVLNPSLPKTDTSEQDGDKKVEEKDRANREDVEEMYGTLKEKLGFLSEGRPPVSPVQTMIIQAETLLMAMREEGLKLSYLQKWLNETYSELIKLEKEAAPEGWLLQWDRSNKRYYYQHQTTGESQWEYPQPDISRCDEAMDISTTPPPIEPEMQMSPPLPPSIRSPTPPPPPIISMEANPSPVSKIPDVPLPPEPGPTKFVDNGEPLPPGVDLPEITTYNKPKEQEAKPDDPLYSALDSFYSDIAAIENTNSSSPPPPPPPIEESKIVEAPTEAVKKKRKPKVKLAPGLAMKKKGVSLLVEKWKNVQQHYND